MRDSLDPAMYPPTSHLSEELLFLGYGLERPAAILADETPAPRVLTPLEIRQRIAAHAEQMAEQRALTEVRARRMRTG